MGKKASPTLIGAFVLGAVALVIVGVAAFGSGRLFRNTQPLVMFFPSSVNGLRLGAAVKFKGVEVGEVTQIMIRLQPRVMPANDRIPVVIEIDKDRLTARGATVTFSPEALDVAVARGLSAQLQPESFVTGVLYVELDFRPGIARPLVGDPEFTYPEIPTAPGALEQVQMKVTELINKLATVDIGRLIDTASETLESLHVLAGSPGLRAALESLDPTLQSVKTAAASVQGLATHLDGDVGPLVKSLSATAQQADGTLTSVRTLIEPGSPLAYQLARTLTDLAEAARAFRGLATELERNPSVIIRGKAPAEEAR